MGRKFKHSEAFFQFGFLFFKMPSFLASWFFAYLLVVLFVLVVVLVVWGQLYYYYFIFYQGV